jgi:MFS family permease
MLGGFVAFGFFTYAVQAWFPAMLMRTYGMAPMAVAWSYGTVFLVFGISGALSVPQLLRWIEGRGINEAPALLCMGASLIAAAPAAAAPLMPTPTLCLGLFAVAMYCWAVVITTSFAAIVLVTPAALRGTMTGFYMILMNVTGGAFGAVAVGLLSDHVFGPENVRYAVAVIGAACMPLAATLFALLRRPYRAALAPT